MIENLFIWIYVAGIGQAVFLTVALVTLSV